MVHDEQWSRCHDDQNFMTSSDRDSASDYSSSAATLRWPGSVLGHQLLQRALGSGMFILRPAVRVGYETTCSSRSAARTTRGSPAEGRAAIEHDRLHPRDRLGVGARSGCPGSGGRSCPLRGLGRERARRGRRFGLRRAWRGRAWFGRRARCRRRVGRAGARRAHEIPRAILVVLTSGSRALVVLADATRLAIVVARALRRRFTGQQGQQAHDEGGQSEGYAVHEFPFASALGARNESVRSVLRARLDAGGGARRARHSRSIDFVVTARSARVRAEPERAAVGGCLRRADESSSRRRATGRRSAR